MIALHVGFNNMFIIIWLRAFLISFVVSLPIAVILVPLIRNGLTYIFEIDYSSNKQIFNNRHFVKQYDQLSRTISMEVYEFMLNHIRKNINSGKVLDIGCGTGAGTLHIAQDKNYQVYAIDPSKNMIKFCEKNAKKTGINLDLKVTKATNLLYDDNTFEFAISNGSLHHWEDPVKAFNEIYRVLKPGGKVFINDFFKNPDKNDILEEFAYKIEPKEMRDAFLQNAPDGAFSKEEVLKYLKKSKFTNFDVEKKKVSLEISMVK